MCYLGQEINSSGGKELRANLISVRIFSVQQRGAGSSQSKWLDGRTSPHTVWCAHPRMCVVSRRQWRPRIIFPPPVMHCYLRLYTLTLHSSLTSPGVSLSYICSCSFDLAFVFPILFTPSALPFKASAKGGQLFRASWGERFQD